MSTKEIILKRLERIEKMLLSSKVVFTGVSSVYLFNTGDDTYKLRGSVPHYNGSTLSHYTTKIFSLPGLIPCNSCNGLKVSELYKQETLLSYPTGCISCWNEAEPKGGLMCQKRSVSLV